MSKTNNGGPFDGGDAMGVATQEKNELRRMVAELVEERDALAAKLAELEGQEPLYFVDEQGLLRKYTSKDFNQCNYGGLLRLYSSPVPAKQPVNARLLAASRAVVARWETPLWKDAPATAGFIYELRDALAESAPKAVRLTDEEINVAYFDAMKQHVRPQDANAVWRVVRCAETAVLRKNGIKVAE